jgi:hypothetical protein
LLKDLLAQGHGAGAREHETDHGGTEMEPSGATIFGNGGYEGR